MTVLRVRARELGERWDIGYHGAPTVSVPEPAYSLHEIAAIRRGYSASTKEYVVVDQRKTCPYIRISDLSDHAISEKSLKHILDTEDIPRNARARTDEVLFSIAGTIGKVALVSASFDRAVASSQIAIIRPREQYACPEFLVRALEAKYVKWQISRAQTGSFIKRLSLEALNGLLLTIPDKETQSAVLRKLRSLELEYEACKQAQNVIGQQIDSIFGGERIE